MSLKQVILLPFAIIAGCSGTPTRPAADLPLTGEEIDEPAVPAESDDTPAADPGLRDAAETPDERPTGEDTQLPPSDAFLPPLDLPVSPPDSPLPEPDEPAPDLPAADPGPDLPAVDAGLDPGVPPQCYGTASTDLPDHVYFRTAKQSFNKLWYVALKDERIWIKPNALMGQPPGTWKKLGSGLPEGPGIVRFPAPTKIVEISADGTHLHALSDQGVFYRGTNFETDLLFFSWTDKWGHPAGEGSGLTAEFPTTHGWSVSDAQQSGVKFYTDASGTEHSVGNGVAHLFRLGPEGRTLFFNDWWLPNDWSRQFCLPGRGTFVAENLSASGSTTFLISRQGEMYTRLYDFDTGGEDDLLEYSYIKADAKVRFLPAEPWLRQPDITDGLITRNITIFQTGQGNGARTLRVEGVRDGKTGFFFKGIFDPSWSFQETGHQVCGPFMNEAPIHPVATEGVSMHGQISHGGSSLGFEILDFNIVCPPARARLSVDGKPVTVGGKPFELQLHHVFGMSGPALTMPIRKTSFWLDGTPALMRAAIVVPDAATLATFDDPGAAKAVADFFGTRKVLNFSGSVTLTQFLMEEISWATIGLCPGDEKSDLFGTPYKLELDAP